MITRKIILLGFFCEAVSAWCSYVGTATSFASEEIAFDLKLKCTSVLSLVEANW